MARAGIDQCVGENCLLLCVDPVRHVRRFRCGDDDLAVGRNRHAFGLDADIDLAHHLASLDIDNRCHRVVLVGDPEVLVVGSEHKLLGVLPGRQVMQDLAGRRVHNLYRVAVGSADIDAAVIGIEGDAARPFAGLDSTHNLQCCRVDHRDRVVLLVRHPDFTG